jgi:hypothetical protein
MQIQRPSKVRKVFGTVSAAMMLFGMIGLGILFATGFRNTEIYWNALWSFMTIFSVGLVAVRVYGIIWSKK